MTNLAIGIGGVLIVLGLGAYLGSETRSVTALIPAFLGILYLAAGFLSRQPKWHKHAMHGAAVIALLGLFGSFSGLLQLPQLFAGTAALPMAVLAQSVTAILSLIFLIFAIRSFITARQQRKTA
jgi:uncharacterized membrane protein